MRCQRTGRGRTHACHAATGLRAGWAASSRVGLNRAAHPSFPIEESFPFMLLLRGRAAARMSSVLIGQMLRSGRTMAVGTAAGMVRMGSALEVTETSGMVPGIGVKSLRDGVPSANWVELVSLAPLPDNNYNFFASDFSNHIAPPADTVTKVRCIALALGLAAWPLPCP